MEQLYMRRPNLDGLPEIPALPDGYTLRKYQDSDLKALAALLSQAFDNTEWTPSRVREVLIDHLDVPATFVIDFNGTAVATASALLDPSGPKETGTIHWVAGDPAHGGKRLGYITSLAVLHEFVRFGCTNSDLLTDDTRLPALKTYFNLGFVPVNRHETHAARWAEISARLGRPVG